MNLANFLCTKSDRPDASSNATLGNLKAAPLSELPHALPPNTSSSAAGLKPLYYLPCKLLPWQADKIDGQVEDMRNEMDKEEDAWQEELRQRDEEIRELKAKAQEASADPARSNGESSRRSRSRRDDGDSDDEGRSALPGRAPLPDREERMDEDDQSRERSTSRVQEANDADKAMAGTAEGEDVVECESFLV